MITGGPAIVGAGPAGSAAAIRLLQAGERPLVIERRADGGDALCGGFLSWRTLDRLAPLGLSREQLGGHPVTSLRLIAGDKARSVNLPRAAMGVSRRRLDGLMLERAETLGASVIRATASFAGGRLRLDSGEPVDSTTFRRSSAWLCLGLRPAFSSAAMNLALVPNTDMRSLSMASSSRAPSRAKGEPSYNTNVAPVARPDTSQFHIIQPQVV